MSNRRKIKMGKLAHVMIRNLGMPGDEYQPPEALTSDKPYHYVTLRSGEPAWCSCPASDDHADA